MGYIQVHARAYTRAYVRVRTVWHMDVRTPVDGNFVMPHTVLHVQISSILIWFEQSLWRLSWSFSVVVHEVCLLVSAIFNLNPHGRPVSVCVEDPHPPARTSASTHVKIRGTRAEDLRHSAQLSADVREEQPWNSSEKVKFAVSCTVHRI